MKMYTIWGSEVRCLIYPVADFRLLVTLFRWLPLTICVPHQGQREAECDSVLLNRVDPDAAAVALDDAMGDEESKPHAGIRIVRSRHIARPKETAEHLRLLLGV